MASHSLGFVTVMIIKQKHSLTVRNNNLIFILCSAPLKSLMRIAVDLKRNFEAGCRTEPEPEP